MNEHDMEWLVRQIVGTAEILGQQITPVAAAMMAEDLETYPREVLAKALSRVRTEHAGRLTPKAIIDRIDEAMGRPAANEAWAVALTALDEAKTVVWTDEIAGAWAAARPIAQAGDMVGARMAFIAAYERLVRDSREARRLPVAQVSLGWDQEQRVQAVQSAVKLGYMSEAQAVEYLPAPEPVFNPLALLAGPAAVSEAAPAETRERIKALRDHIARLNRRDAVLRKWRLRKEAQAVRAKKAAAQRATDEALARMGA